VSGAWSVTFTAPAVVGSDTYNLYIDMADADYPDGEETPTDTFITDRVTVYYFAVDDSRVDVSTAIEARVKAVLEYDDTPLGSGDSIQINSTAATWDSTNGWFDAQFTESTVVNKTFTVTGASEATYGVTSFTSNVSDPTGVWDRIKLLTLTASESSVPVGTAVELRATAELEYDGHALGSGDSLAIEGVAFTWDSTDGRFEATVSKDTAQTVTYDTFTSGSEADYGVTAGTMNGLSVAVEWYGETQTSASGSSTPTTTTTTPTAPPPETPITPAKPPIVQYGPYIIALTVIGVFLYSGYRESNQARRRKRLAKVALPRGGGDALRRLMRKVKKEVKW
jgi:hypothetical protein